MSGKIIIDAATGEFKLGPFALDQALILDSTEEELEAPGGWPDTKEYIPATKAFIDIIQPLEPISSLEFIDRFTLEEKLATISSDHILVKLVVFETQSADLIHLDNPRVLDGLDLLVSQGIITLARKDEILSG